MDANMGVARILEHVVRTTSGYKGNVTRVIVCSYPHSSQHTPYVASRSSTSLHRQDPLDILARPRHRWFPPCSAEKVGDFAYRRRRICCRLLTLPLQHCVCYITVAPEAPKTLVPQTRQNNYFVLRMRRHTPEPVSSVKIITYAI